MMVHIVESTEAASGLYDSILRKAGEHRMKRCIQRIWDMQLLQQQRTLKSKMHYYTDCIRSNCKSGVQVQTEDRDYRCKHQMRHTLRRMQIYWGVQSVLNSIEVANSTDDICSRRD